MSFSAINDAVHGVISLDDDKLAKEVKSIIDNPLFQRLRHIKQLGLVDLIFPSATHTRFNHSLGCAYIASRMCSALEIKDDLLRECVITALLHDIGHGPFSHTFEKLLISGKNKITHEDWTQNFIDGFSINNFDSSKALGYIKGTSEYKDSNENLIADIISSQLDADRLDYLLRDSHFCGVPFGNIDLNWILNKLEKIDNVENSPRLGIHRKATNSVEHYLLARMLMTKSIYHHPLAMLFEKLLITFLERFIDNQPSYCPFARMFTGKNDSLRDFFILCREYREGKKDNKNFLSDAYEYYKVLVDYDIWNLVRETATAKNEKDEKKEIALLIYERGNKYTIHRLNPSESSYDENAIKIFRKEKNIPEWKTPILEGGVTAYRDSKKELLSFSKDKKPTQITEYSHILN